MTNVKVDRKDVLSPREVEAMLERANETGNEYFRLRAKAVVSLFKTGKRRAEISSLEVKDLKVEAGYLYVTFSVVKKRKKNVVTTRRTKRFPLTSVYSQHILAYWEYMKKNHPNCKYLFPSVHNVFGLDLAFSLDQHLSGRQILRIVKALNPNAWCHLFRESRGAEVVQADERKEGVSIFTVYRVKHALDLEKETTAWNYINRYATETIETETEKLDEVGE